MRVVLESCRVMKMEPFRLDGRVVVITGAAGRIGSSTARLFASRGALLVLADVDAGTNMESLIREIGSPALPWNGDLSQVAKCYELIETAVSTFGRLDTLINNAGICPRISFLDSSEADWDRIVSANQKSMFFCSQAAARHLMETKGSIISTASYAGRAGAMANASIYSGTKGAIVALTKTLARELAPHVRVNAIAPGAIDTPMVRNLLPEQLRSVIQTIPLNRLGTTEDVAAAMLFLAAEESRYITGSTIDINGGTFMS